ncbi:MAG TPA: hypothetical protein VN726_01675 [Hanamia sp.]|nr:hypothetical protein [Hanamia sp.]
MTPFMEKGSVAVGTEGQTANNSEPTNDAVFIFLPLSIQMRKHFLDLSLLFSTVQIIKKLLAEHQQFW